KKKQQRQCTRSNQFCSLFHNKSSSVGMGSTPAFALQYAPIWKNPNIFCYHPLFQTVCQAFSVRCRQAVPIMLSYRIDAGKPLNQNFRIKPSLSI
ncbi:MAG: hypothetical protein Q4A48_07885, partial [Bacillota bacterium]|nr:hypothetical protein [Bacillota bacterium]